MYFYVSFLTIGPMAISIGGATTLQLQNLIFKQNKRFCKFKYVK